MDTPPRIRWLHPVVIVCGFIIASEAAVVGYESCAPRESASEAPAPTIPTVIFTAAPLAPPERSGSRPAAPIRQTQAAAESPAVPRALPHQAPVDAETVSSWPAPEVQSAAVASASRVATDHISLALRDSISRLEADLQAPDAGDVEGKRRQLEQARASLRQLESGDAGASSRGTPDAGSR